MSWVKWFSICSHSKSHLILLVYLWINIYPACQHDTPQSRLPPHCHAPASRADSFACFLPWHRRRAWRCGCSWPDANYRCSCSCSMTICLLLLLLPWHTPTPSRRVDSNKLFLRPAATALSKSLRRRAVKPGQGARQARMLEPWPMQFYVFN